MSPSFKLVWNSLLRRSRIGLSFLFALSGLTCSLSAQSILFDYTYGYADYSFGKSIVQMADSGYVFLANTGNPNGNARLLLVRLDQFGIPQFYKEFHDYDLYNGNFLIKAANGDLLITGEVKNDNTPYQPFVMRVDSLFNVKWTFVLPCNDWSFSRQLLELPNREIVMVGETYDTDTTSVDALWVKLSETGQSLSVIKSELPGDDGFTSVSLWSDSLMLVSGFQQNLITNDSVPFYSLMNFNGENHHHVQYGAIRNKAVSTQTLRDPFGKVVTIGYTRMYDDLEYKDFYLILFDSAGNSLYSSYVDYPIWQHADDEYSSMGIAANGDLIVGVNAEGNSYYKPTIILHLYRGGDYAFKRSVVRSGTGYQKSDILSQVIPTNDGGFILIGTTTSLGTHLSDILICKLDSNLTPITPTSHYLPVEESRDSPAYSLFPNPATSKISLFVDQKQNEYVQISLYNTQSILLWSGQHNFFMQPQIDFDLTRYPPGLYFLKIHGKGYQLHLKISKVNAR